MAQSVKRLLWLRLQSRGPRMDPQMSRYQAPYRAPCSVGSLFFSLSALPQEIRSPDHQKEYKSHFWTLFQKWLLT